MLFLKLYVKVSNYLKDQKGQGMVEYGLIIAAIAVVVLVALGTLGNQLKGLFNGFGTKLTPPT